MSSQISFSFIVWPLDTIHCMLSW